MASVEGEHSKRKFLSMNSIHDVLECVICLEVPRKEPIYQCENGHLLCVLCNKRVVDCPLCKVELRNIRALAVEKILQKCPRPCKFQETGCKTQMRQLSLIEHEKLCTFKPELPSRLSNSNKSRVIKYLSEYKCQYQHQEEESSAQNFNPGLIRSDKPIPLSLESIYYFEVKVLNKGKETAIGIGLTVESSQLNRLPGWDRNTIGYHGE